MPCKFTRHIGIMPQSVVLLYALSPQISCILSARLLQVYSAVRRPSLPLHTIITINQTIFDFARDKF